MNLSDDQIILLFCYGHLDHLIEDLSFVVLSVFPDPLKNMLSSQGLVGHPVTI